jgi:hypothetical protein
MIAAFSGAAASSISRHVCSFQQVPERGSVQLKDASHHQRSSTPIKQHLTACSKHHSPSLLTVRCVRLPLMVGSFRESKVQLPLADKRLEVLIPESVWLPIHQLRQATQRDEPPLAKLQHDNDEHLTIDFALGSGLRGHPFQTRAQRLGERLQIIHHRQRQLLRDQAASGSRFSAKFGELGTEIRVAGPKTSSGVGMGSTGEVVHRTPPTGGLQQAGLGQVLESLRKIERMLGGDGS